MARNVVVAGETGRRRRAGAWAALCALAAVAAAAAEPGTNCVPNGGFERTDPDVAGKPQFWDPPDELGVQWVDVPTAAHNTDAAASGRAIRLDTQISERRMVQQWKSKGIEKWDIPNPAAGPVAATYGLSFYSDAIPVASGQAYRVSFSYMGPSGGAKLWVRGYGMFRGRLRRRYETIVNCRTTGPGWNRFSQVFHPTRLRPRVREMKVMLYAYWPPGVYLFDNVHITPIDDEEYERDR